MIRKGASKGAFALLLVFAISEKAIPRNVVSLYGRDMQYRRTTIFHASIVNTHYLRMQHIDIVCNVYRARKFAAANVLRFVALRRAISCNPVVLLKVMLPSRNPLFTILKNDLKSYQSIKSQTMPKN